MSEVDDTFPEPTMRIGKRVRAYCSSAEPTQWAYLDFEMWPRPDSDPLLRNVRLPANKAHLGLVFTPSGKANHFRPS